MNRSGRGATSSLLRSGAGPGVGGRLAQLAAARRAVVVLVEECAGPDLHVVPRGDGTEVVEAAAGRAAGAAFDLIGQLNLVELQRAAPKEAAALPSTTMRGGAPVDPERRGGGRVLYCPGDVTDLKVGSPPPDVELYRVLAPRTATFRREGPALPPCESPYYPVLLGGGGYNDALSRAAESLGPLLEASGVAPPLGSEFDDRPRQRVLGYGDPLQSSPNVNCEGYSSGRAPEKWADTSDFWNRAADWQLLFQADSEYGEPDVMFGDGGLLYFMIRPAALVARRFEAAWTDWQSD